MQMFSSTYNDYSNPFPNFPSSSSSSSYPTTLPFLIDPENDFSNTLLNDPLSLPFIPSTTTINHDSLPFHVQIQNEENVTNLADCTAMFEQDHVNNSYASAVAVAVASAAANYVGNSNGIPNYLTQKPAIAKKDRHSKIHTSQGLRDRRVRLSSEIARKFFDLQDMLEFDKPSNTLEWLFTKSENAIKELARSKNNNSAYTEKDEVVDSNNNKSLTTTTTYGGSGDGSKGRKLKWTQRGEDGFCVQSKKESRERARARARERTCYKRVQDFEENSRCPATTNTQMLQQMMSSPIQNVQPYPPLSHLLLDSETQRDHHGYNVIEESIMIKRNMMSSHTHQNLASFNNNIDNNNNIDYPLLPYSTPNWDPNGFSNFCGIATMNMSTCFMNQWC